MTKKNRKRDGDFLQSTIDKLAKRAAYHCSNCRISTLSASEFNDYDHAHTGQAAHIIAAAPNGPRAKNDLIPKEKSSIANGIYLCEICAKLIDANRGKDYPPKRLQKMKNDHERLTRIGIIPMSPERFAKIIGYDDQKSAASLVVKPDLALRFVYPKCSALVLINQSSVVAKDIKWTVAIWNMDLPDRNDPLPIPVSTFDWIRPHNRSGPQDLFNSPHIIPLLKSGDRLFGSASVCSPSCIRGRTYIIYIVWGKDGWFAEVEEEESGNILIPPNFLKNTRDQYFKALEAMIPIKSRILITNS